MTKNEKLLDAVRIGKTGLELTTSIGSAYLIGNIVGVVAEDTKLFMRICCGVSYVVISAAAYLKEYEFIEKVFEPIEDNLEAKIKKEKC